MSDPGPEAFELARLPALADGEVDLLEASLAIARDEYPDLDLAACRREVEALAVEAARDAPVEPGARLAALAQALYERCGFRGNEDDYYDPRNSYLNDVLERRLGIPISLSVLHLEVGGRLGLRLEPISFPAHFLVRCVTPGAEAVIDPFRGGRRLGHANLLAMLAAVVGERGAREHLPRALSRVARREVVARMLRNLKAIYMRREDLERALRVTDRLVSVAPEALGELRDRGHLYARIGAARAALADYTRYLDQSPDAPDADTVRSLAVSLGASAGRLN